MLAGTLVIPRYIIRDLSRVVPSAKQEESETFSSTITSKASQ